MYPAPPLVCLGFPLDNEGMVLSLQLKIGCQSEPDLIIIEPRNS
ncbi:MAG: hypothetical protein H6Q96_317, partial [Nitrospirae bacterium]|nr:hypothetical protein [Nitrospirota bacterium]